MLSTYDVAIKGFKGKGAAWVSQARAQLAEIHAAMHALSKETRAIRGHDFTLVVHTRGKSGQKCLRWRLSGTPPRHVTWEAIVSQVAALPTALAQWYRQANAAALVLNHQEMVARHELRMALQLQDLQRHADHAYERICASKDA